MGGPDLACRFYIWPWYIEQLVKFKFYRAISGNIDYFNKNMNYIDAPPNIIHQSFIYTLLHTILWDTSKIIACSPHIQQPAAANLYSESFT